MTHADMCKPFIELNGFITTLDIVRITNTTTPHSVIRNLKKMYNFKEEPRQNPKTKVMYKIFIVESRK